MHPSFDCAAATLPAEKTICADPQLAAADIDEAQYYQDNLQTAGNFGDTAKVGTLKQDERHFVAQRNQCGSAAWCIQRVYADWDRQLENVGGARRAGRRRDAAHSQNREPTWGPGCCIGSQGHGR